MSIISLSDKSLLLFSPIYRRNRLIPVCLFMFIFFIDSSAQTLEGIGINHRDSVQVNNLGILFNHHGNIYTWFGRGKYLFSKSDMTLSVTEEFSSNIVESTQKFIQDNQNLKIGLTDKLFDEIKYTIRLNSTVFSDDKSIGISNAFTHDALGGIIYNPFRQFSVMALGGWKFDNQVGNKDNGASFLINSRLENYDVEGYISNIEAEWTNDYLNPRFNGNRWMNVTVQKRFSPGAYNNLSFFHRNFDKDFYIMSNNDGSNNIERRNEKNLLIVDELFYMPDDWLSLSLATFFSTKDVIKSLKTKSLDFISSNIFDSKIEELKIDLVFQVNTDFDWMKNSFKIGLNQREENHQLEYYEGVSRNYYMSRSKSESYKDNTSISNFISFSNYFSLSSSNLLSLRGIYSLLRYDTPSDNNYDDRDEVHILFNIADEHKFSNNLLIRTLFEFNRYRTIFIFGERSANNQSNNIIKLNIFSDYNYQNILRTKNLFEVLANYTVYDYRDKIISLRNLAFRQFQFFDSTSVNFSIRTGLDFFSNIRLSERGELFWDEFKEKPADFYFDETYSLTFWIKSGTLWKFGAGYKTYSQKRYVYEKNKKKLDYEQLNHGPTFYVDHDFYEKFKIRFEGWLEYLSTDNTSGSINKNMNIDFFYYF